MIVRRPDSPVALPVYARSTRGALALADRPAVATDRRGRLFLVPPRENPPGRYFPGLGYDYYDLLAQAGMESCSPMDSACVSRNVQRQNAVEDYWINTGMRDSSAAGAPAPTITVNTSAQQAAQYAADAAAALPGGNIAQTGGSITTGGQTFTDTALEQAQGYATPYTRSTTTTAAKPAAVINSSGGSNAPAPIASPAGSFSFDSLKASVTSSGVPWYVWAGGGLAVLLFLKGRS